ncbi:hypothetical protein [Mastigocoleus sp. MO_188.B34]|nr:hypothetical protein [Mastigocoleus sp. MO_188.B34]
MLAKPVRLPVVLFPIEDERCRGLNSPTVSVSAKLIVYFHGQWSDTND